MHKRGFKTLQKTEKERPCLPTEGDRIEMLKIVCGAAFFCGDKSPEDVNFFLELYFPFFLLLLTVKTNVLLRLRSFMKVVAQVLTFVLGHVFAPALAAGD